MMIKKLLEIYLSSDILNLIIAILVIIVTHFLLKSELLFKLFNHKQFKLKYYDDVADTIEYCLDHNNKDIIKT